MYNILQLGSGWVGISFWHKCYSLTNWWPRVLFECLYSRKIKKKKKTLTQMSPSLWSFLCLHSQRLCLFSITFITFFVWSNYLTVILHCFLLLFIQQTFTEYLPCASRTGPWGKISEQDTVPDLKSFKFRDGER